MPRNGNACCFVYFQALTTLAAQNTEKGMDFAAHSVAKIAITMNPEVAFPGQRVRAKTPPQPNQHFNHFNKLDGKKKQKQKQNKTKKTSRACEL